MFIPLPGINGKTLGTKACLFYCLAKRKIGICRMGAKLDK
jgi:hypothetical protein